MDYLQANTTIPITIEAATDWEPDPESGVLEVTKYGNKTFSTGIIISISEEKWKTYVDVKLNEDLSINVVSPFPGETIKQDIYGNDYWEDEIVNFKLYKGDIYIFDSYDKENYYCNIDLYPKDEHLTGGIQITFNMIDVITYIEEQEKLLSESLQEVNIFGPQSIVMSYSR